MSSQLYIEKRTTVITKLRKVRIIEVRECNMRFGKTARGSLEICAQCVGVSMMMTAASAAKISGIGIEAVSQLVEAREIHFAEGEAGLLVCLNSIAQHYGRRL
jgi:hypothetical protein